MWVKWASPQANDPFTNSYWRYGQTFNQPRQLNFHNQRQRLGNSLADIVK